MATNDPNIPPPDGTCHFFRLSGELRNQIYAYALSERYDLCYREDVRGGCHLHRRSGTNILATAGPEANQLKYANRQLYMETRGLGIRYNDIYFQNFNDISIFFKGLPKDACRYVGAVHVQKAFPVRSRMRRRPPWICVRDLAEKRRLIKFMEHRMGSDGWETFRLGRESVAEAFKDLGLRNGSA